MLEAKARGSMNKGEGGCVETQGLQEMAEVSCVRRACDRRQGDVGRLWQDLNMAYAHFPRCVLEGPEGPRNPAAQPGSTSQVPGTSRCPTLPEEEPQDNQLLSPG